MIGATLLTESRQAKAESIADACVESARNIMKEGIQSERPWQSDEIDEIEFFKEIRWQIIVKTALLDNPMQK